MVSFVQVDDDGAAPAEGAPRFKFVQVDNKPPASERLAKRPWWHAAKEGVQDIGVGAGQLAAHAITAAGAPFGKGQGYAPAWDDFVKQREGAIAAERKAAEERGIDGWRLGGNALAALPLAALSPLAAGAVGGLMSPVARGSFPVEKAEQVGLGAAGGKLAEIGGNAMGSLIRRGGEKLSGIAPESLKEQAARVIGKRFAQDAATGGMTAADAINHAIAAQTAGKPLTLADLGEGNIRGLAGYVARQPGEGRNMMRGALNDRLDGSGQRLSADIAGAFGSGSAHDAAKVLAETQKTAASPLYDAAYAANEKIESPELSKIIETPAGRKALGKAVEKMRNDRTLVGKPDPELTSLVKELSERGQMDNPQTGIGVARGLKLRTWDYVKRSLDDQISAARRAGENDDVRILSGMKGDLVRQLDQADSTATRDMDGKIVSPGKYAQARKVFSGVKQSEDALEFGRNILKMDPAEIADAFKKLSPGDQEFAKLGVSSILREQIAKSGPSIAGRKILGKAGEDSWVRQQIRPLFGSDADYDKFIGAVDSEVKMFDTRNEVLAGSQTQARSIEDSSGDNKAMGSAASLAKELVSGNALGSLKHALALRRDLGLRSNPELNGEIAKMLLDTQLKPQGETAARLLGTFAGPATRNYLAPYARGVQMGGNALAPAAGMGAAGLIGQ